MTQTPETTVQQYLVANFLSACGLIASVLGDESSWEGPTMFPKTLGAIRQMPPEYQEQIARPILADIWDAVNTNDGVDTWRLADMDEAIAVTITDGYAHVINQMKEAAGRQPGLIQATMR